MLWSHDNKNLSLPGILIPFLGHIYLIYINKNIASQYVPNWIDTQGDIFK